MPSAEYQREYWKKNPDKYEKHKVRMREYLQKNRKKNIERCKEWQDSIDYAKYHRDRRAKRIKEGYCSRCTRYKAVEGRKECQKCIDYRKNIK